MALPGPGEHSAHPKYWPGIARWVTNFTPFALQATPIVGLSPDSEGGLWFGIGQTIEHIARSGRMTSYAVTTDYWQSLWQVWDIARDVHGRRWFSLGQSGRIGTLDSAGRVRTRVLVARRFFSDVRALRFAADGALWFVDVGRRSIGYRSVGGAVREVPMPDGAMPVDIALCRGRAYVTAQDSYPHEYVRDVLYAVAPGSLDLKPVAQFPYSSAYIKQGAFSLACDHQDNLWFAHAAKRASAVGHVAEPASSVDGYVDRRNEVHMRYSRLSRERVVPTPDGGVMFMGGRIDQPTGNDASRVTLSFRLRNEIREWTLPMDAADFDDNAAAGVDGTLWLACYPYPITRLSPTP